MKWHHILFVLIALVAIAWIGARMENKPLDIVSVGETVSGVLIVSM